MIRLFDQTMIKPSRAVAYDGKARIEMHGGSLYIQESYATGQKDVYPTIVSDLDLLYAQVTGQILGWSNLGVVKSWGGQILGWSNLGVVKYWVQAFAKGG